VQRIVRAETEDAARMMGDASDGEAGIWVPGSLSPLLRTSHGFAKT
jgi:hypothetical protein